MKLFTIITVCLNAEDDIESTIQSVLDQDYDNFEYLIKDGASNDQTVKIAESYASAFADKRISFRIISQEDRGIYDAMNVATHEAQGQWILYMNAGDHFADKTVLSMVSRIEKLEMADIVYGDEILRNNDLYLFKKARALESIRFEMPFRHQSVFTRKELLDKNPFSLRYRICSDYLFYLQMYSEGKKFMYIPVAISIFDVNGISSDYKNVHQELLKMYEERPVRDEEAIQMEKNTLKQYNKKIFAYEHLWKFVPQKIRQIRRDFLKKKAGWQTKEDFFRIESNSVR